MQARHHAGEIVDPRAVQIERLKAEVAELKDRAARRDGTIAELKQFQQQAISRLAAQHDEIMRLRGQAADGSNVAALPSRSSTNGDDLSRVRGSVGLPRRLTGGS